MFKVIMFFLLLQDPAMFQISSRTITTAGPVISVAVMDSLMHFVAGVEMLHAVVIF